MLRLGVLAPLLAALATGCANVPSNRTIAHINTAVTSSALPPPIKKRAVVKPEKLSDYGNKQFYTVKNKRYEVKPARVGHSEQGLASWYGKKFHNRLTSNRETFDMHKLTAAHKSLPLPSYVKVTNLKNGREVIARVNDRGPFRHKRIIDLSYAAAKALDMVDAGVVPVNMEVIRVPAEQHRIAQNIAYIQVAAYNSKAYANDLVKKLKAKNLKAFIARDARQQKSLHRVRIGPLHRTLELERAKTALDRFGYRGYKVMNR